MEIEYISFKDRSARSTFVGQRFARFLQGKVLDVGCDEANLRRLTPQIEYTGVDAFGHPDIKLNLEEIEALPFPDEFFDCVLCIDVLEHLDNLHAVFGQLVRVVKKHLVIALPNNWANARLAIARGKGAIGHYGLPAEPPRDRHKWFFSLSEAKAFAIEQEKQLPLSIVELFASAKPKSKLIRIMRRLVFPSKERYLNRYANTLWLVFEKTSATSPERDLALSIHPGMASGEFQDLSHKENPYPVDY